MGKFKNKSNNKDINKNNNKDINKNFDKDTYISSNKFQLVAGINALEVAFKVAVDIENNNNFSEIIPQIYIDPERKNARLDKLKAKASKYKVQIIETPSDKIYKLSGAEKHQGVCAKVFIPAVIDEVDFWERFTDFDNKRLLILDQVQDVHNLGACVRVANASGALAVVIPKNNSAKYSAQVAKAASGATLETPILEVNNLASFIKEIKQHGFWVVGFSDQAEQDYTEIDYNGAYALVLGGEQSGARRLTLELCDYLVSIPMAGSVSSLNVSVACGIALYGAVVK